MTTSDLLVRYKNLLIVLSRYQLAMVEGSKAIRQAAAIEPMNGRRSGLMCKARSMGSTAESLRVAIHRNNAAMKHFFGTTNLKTVADNLIEYDVSSLTDSQPALSSENYAEEK